MIIIIIIIIIGDIQMDPYMFNIGVLGLPIIGLTDSTLPCVYTFLSIPVHP